MAGGTNRKNRREAARRAGRGGRAAERRDARERAIRRAKEKTLSQDLSELLANAHSFAASFTGIPILGISAEEVEPLAKAIARVIVAKGKLPKAEKTIEKHGPWANFALVLAAVYGPRLVMLWRLYQAERDRQNRRGIAVMPAREEDQDTAAVDPTKAVN